MKLQSCFVIAEEWPNEWLLLYNKSKCNALSSRNKFDSAVYRMDTWDTELELENTSCEKEIAVLIDSKLNFDPHILSVVKKANSIKPNSCV